MTTEARVLTYWPTWVGWTTGLCAVFGPPALFVTFRMELIVAMIICWWPPFFAGLLFAPRPDEQDTDTLALRPRTREDWVRAWRRALAALVVLVPIEVALYFGIMSLDLS